MIKASRGIAASVKTGKTSFGTKRAIKDAKTARAKLVIIASNCPQKGRDSIEYYCRLSKVPTLIYDGTSLDLGAVCGKPFGVSAIAVREPGDSDIMKLVEAQNG